MPIYKNKDTRKGKYHNIADRLSVISYIYFDNNECFCQYPWCHLVAWKLDRKIGIGIRDYDDFDIGLIYKPETEEDFFNILHELISWMIDHEQGISIYDELINPFNFFTDLGIKREYW